LLGHPAGVEAFPNEGRHLMIGPKGRRLAAGVAALAIGAIGAVAVESPALAADFSAGYLCTAPILGTENVTIGGSLAATPNPATVGSPTTVNLHMSDISLRAPLTINSWSITAVLETSGAETAQFPVTGTGGRVPANGAITGDLTGTFTPTAAGTDEIRGGNVTVIANVFLIGNVTIACTPVDPRPVGETLTVS
jgi:hypothetical protein